MSGGDEGTHQSMKVTGNPTWSTWTNENRPTAVPSLAASLLSKTHPLNVIPSGLSVLVRSLSYSAMLTALPALPRLPIKSQCSKKKLLLYEKLKELMETAHPTGLTNSIVEEGIVVEVERVVLTPVRVGEVDRTPIDLGGVAGEGTSCYHH